MVVCFEKAATVPFWVVCFFYWHLHSFSVSSFFLPSRPLLSGSVLLCFYLQCPFSPYPVSNNRDSCLKCTICVKEKNMPASLIQAEPLLLFSGICPFLCWCRF